MITFNANENNSNKNRFQKSEPWKKQPQMCSAAPRKRNRPDNQQSGTFQTVSMAQLSVAEALYALCDEFQMPNFHTTTQRLSLRKKGPTAGASAPTLDSLQGALVQSIHRFIVIPGIIDNGSGTSVPQLSLFTTIVASRRTAVYQTYHEHDTTGKRPERANIPPSGIDNTENHSVMFWTVDRLLSNRITRRLIFRAFLSNESCPLLLFAIKKAARSGFQGMGLDATLLCDRVFEAAADAFPAMVLSLLSLVWHPEASYGIRKKQATIAARVRKQLFLITSSIIRHPEHLLLFFTVLQEFFFSISQICDPPQPLSLITPREDDVHCLFDNTAKQWLFTISRHVSFWFYSSMQSLLPLPFLFPNEQKAVVHLFTLLPSDDFFVVAQCVHEASQLPVHVLLHAVKQSARSIEGTHQNLLFPLFHLVLKLFIGFKLRQEFGDLETSKHLTSETLLKDFARLLLMLSRALCGKDAGQEPTAEELLTFGLVKKTDEVNLVVNPDGAKLTIKLANQLSAAPSETNQIAILVLLHQVGRRILTGTLIATQFTPTQKASLRAAEEGESYLPLFDVLSGEPSTALRQLVDPLVYEQLKHNFLSLPQIVVKCAEDAHWPLSFLVADAFTHTALCRILTCLLLVPFLADAADIKMKGSDNFLEKGMNIDEDEATEPLWDRVVSKNAVDQEEGQKLLRYQLSAIRGFTVLFSAQGSASGVHLLRWLREDPVANVLGCQTRQSRSGRRMEPTPSFSQSMCPNGIPTPATPHPMWWPHWAGCDAGRVADSFVSLSHNTAKLPGSVLELLLPTAIDAIGGTIAHCAEPPYSAEFSAEFLALAEILTPMLGVDWIISSWEARIVAAKQALAESV